MAIVAFAARRLLDPQYLPVGLSHNCNIESRPGLPIVTGCNIKSLLPALLTVFIIIAGVARPSSELSPIHTFDRTQTPAVCNRTQSLSCDSLKYELLGEDFNGNMAVEGLAEATSVGA